MGACCGHDHGEFDGMSKGYKSRLWAVIAINAAMFLVEMTAGQMAGFAGAEGRCARLLRRCG
jgi:Co/Zn/Cd efflux system component